MPRPGRSSEYAGQREATRARMARLRARRRLAPAPTETPGTFHNLFLNHDPRAMPAPPLEDQSAFGHFDELREALVAASPEYDAERLNSPSPVSATEPLPPNTPRESHDPHAAGEFLPDPRMLPLNTHGIQHFVSIHRFYLLTSPDPICLSLPSSQNLPLHLPLRMISPRRCWPAPLLISCCSIMGAGKNPIRRPPQYPPTQSPCPV